MVVLLNTLKDGKERVVAKDWLMENGSKIKDKHIFYIVRPRDICDVLIFKPFVQAGLNMGSIRIKRMPAMIVLFGMLAAM